MERLVATLGCLAGRDEGQDLIEYALLAALIAVAAVVGVTALGNSVNTVLWQFIAVNV